MRKKMSEFKNHQDSIAERENPFSLYSFLILIFVSIVFYLGAKLGLRLSAPPDHIATFWPPNTVILTALLLTNPRRWWLYFLAMTPAYLTAAFQGGYSINRSLIFFLANCTEIIVAAVALKHYCKEKLIFSKVRGMILFLVWAVLIAPFISAFIASLTTFNEPTVNYWLAWRVWFLGDALGHLTITPVLFTWIMSGTRGIQQISLARFAEALTLGISLLLIGFFALGFEVGTPGNLPFLLYSPMPLMLWAAIRFGPQGICSAVLTITVLSIWNAINGRGPFTEFTPAGNVLSLQMFLLVISIPTMLLGTLFTERKKIEMQYTELVENSKSAILKLQNGVIIFFNEFAQELFGFSKEEVLGKHVLETIIPKEDRFGKDLTKMVMDAFAQPSEFDYNENENIKKSGERIWVAWKNKIIINPESGKEEMLSIGFDITDRKKSEEKIKKSHKEKEVLLQEIHHRVKNNFAVIISLLKLQSVNIEDEDVKSIIKDSENRIRSMSMVHEMLYRTENLSHIDFGEYINALGETLLRTYNVSPARVRLKVDIKEINLNTDTSIILGLVINELISNAMKHAFPGDRSGEINIGMKSIDNEYELIIEDTGIGMPDGIDIWNTDTLGLKIVTNMVERQLGGRIEMKINEGTEYKIRFKMLENTKSLSREL